MLHIGDFKAVEPGAPCVDELSDLISANGRIWRGREVGFRKGLLRDRIVEILVEKSRGNHAEGIEVMFDEQVEIVCRLRFEARIAEGGRVLRIVWCHEGPGNSLGDILGIGTGEAAGIGEPEEGVAIQGVADGSTG